MPDSLALLKAKIDEQLTAIGTLQPQYDAALIAADQAATTRDSLWQQLNYHQSVLTGLKNNLYAFFESTLIANPEADTYEQMGEIMDALAAATPPPPPPPPPEEEPPPEQMTASPSPEEAQEVEGSPPDEDEEVS